MPPMVEDLRFHLLINRSHNGEQAGFEVADERFFSNNRDADIPAERIRREAR